LNAGNDKQASLLKSDDRLQKGNKW
jgi:hypothetical protein